MKPSKKEVDRIAAQEVALACIRKRCPPGHIFFCVVKHISRDGLERRMNFYDYNGSEMIDMNDLFADALGYPLYNNLNLVVRGAGMDMVRDTLNRISGLAWGERGKYGVQIL